MTKPENVEEWKVFSGELYKKSQFQWKQLISEEISGVKDLTFGLGKVDPNDVHGVHRHPHGDEIYYVLEGTARVTLGNENIDATPGTAIYIPKGMKHGITNDGDKSFLLLWMIRGQFQTEDYMGKNC